MKRPLAAAAAPLLALTLSVTAGPAHAAPARRADFPTLKQVGVAFPMLKNAEREITSSAVVSFPTSCTDNATLRATSGKLANYNDFKSPVVASLSVTQMRSTKQAARVTEGFGTLSKCGEYVEGEVTFTVSRLKAPKLGHQSLGLSLSTTEDGTKVTMDHYVLRKSNRLIRVAVWYVGAKPQRARAAKLVRLAYRRGI